jgi:hypothetical protein
MPNPDEIKANLIAHTEAIEGLKLNIFEDISNQTKYKDILI